LLLLLIITLPAAVEGTQEAELRLWYRQPAENWFQAIPVGNGRLGAMVFGGVEKERIQLNENTIWSGNRSDFDREGAYKHLDEARKLLFEGKYVEAGALVGREFMGEPVTFTQSEKDLSIQLSEGQYDAPVTVIELTLDQPLKVGVALGSVRGEDLSEHGKILSENATLKISSQSRHDKGEHERFFKGPRAKYGDAFVTERENNPWAEVDLGAVKNVKAIVIENKPTERRSEGLILSVSTDGQKWQEVWKAEDWDLSWTIPLTTFEARADVPGQKARYFKLETKGDSARPLILQRFTAYGDG
jgi:hypothetical protein